MICRVDVDRVPEVMERERERERERGVCVRERKELWGKTKNNRNMFFTYSRRARAQSVRSEERRGWIFVLILIEFICFDQSRRSAAISDESNERPQPLVALTTCARAVRHSAIPPPPFFLNRIFSKVRSV